jgi:hypothetical protein
MSPRNRGPGRQRRRAGERFNCNWNCPRRGGVVLFRDTDETSPSNMNTANWLTFLASLIAFLSVVGAIFTSRWQIKNANYVAVKQIEAAASETSRRLRAEIIVKDRQLWIKEFRDTINELLYVGDPYLDHSRTSIASERVGQLTRLALKVDLMLPASEIHGALSSAIAQFADQLMQGAEITEKERLEVSNTIVVMARRILKDELEAVNSSI